MSILGKYFAKLFVDPQRLEPTVPATPAVATMLLIVKALPAFMRKITSLAAGRPNTLVAIS